jgi:hypothetical protein
MIIQSDFDAMIAILIGRTGGTPFIIPGRLNLTLFGEASSSCMTWNLHDLSRYER